MLLKDNKGALRTVVEVIPAVEKREVFNGKKRFLLERCADASVKPNALAFEFEDNSDSSMMMTVSQPKLLIGNLKSEVAESIISDMMKNGVADLSGFKYQKETPAINMAKFDNGATLPYITENFISFTDDNIFSSCPAARVPFCNTEYFEDEEGDDDVDLSVYSDEDLRRMIYESGDITMPTLVAMSREALEEKYYNMEG